MALPIRQRLSALTCLKAGPKAVLMEVCELHENGGRGCFISNDTLSKKLGVSLATATRTVASLAAWGLLLARVVPAEANRRYLTPSAAVRACYAAGSEAQQLAAVSELTSELTIAKTGPAPEVTIVKPECDYSQTNEVTIVKPECDYSQTASRVIGDEQDDQKTTIDDQLVRGLREALAETENELYAAQKKIVELEAQLQATIVPHTEGGATDVATRKPPAAEQRPGKPARSAAYRDFASPWPPALRVPWPDAEFHAAWGRWASYLADEAGKRHGGAISEQADLDQLQTKAGAGGLVRAIQIIDESISRGWKALIDNQPRQNTPSHATPNQPFAAQARPVNGHKPAGNGGPMARYLAELE